MNKRTLHLKLEGLSDLSTDDLRGVVGASHICPTHDISCEWCPTVPLNECQIDVVTLVC